MSVRPSKTQISLGIRPVWSESSLCAHWVAKDPRFLHADSEDSDQSGRMSRLIWVFAGRTLTLLVLSCRGSYIVKWKLKNWRIIHHISCWNLWNFFFFIWPIGNNTYTLMSLSPIIKSSYANEMDGAYLSLLIHECWKKKPTSLFCWKPEPKRRGFQLLSRCPASVKARINVSDKSAIHTK